MNIGDKVVCIRTHCNNAVIKNNIYVVCGVYTCNCGHVMLDVGIINGDHNTLSECSYCGKCIRTNTWWVSQRLFSPINNFITSTEIDAIKEEILDAPIPKLNNTI